MKEQVKAFLQNINQNEALRKRFIAAGDKEEAEGIIKETGFFFSLEDYRQAAKELEQEAGIEILTDDNLDKVAGGFCSPICDPVAICKPACSLKCDPDCDPAPCKPKKRPE